MVSPAGAIGVAKLRTACAVACPVIAGVICAIRIGSSIRLGTGEHVMCIGRVAGAIHHFSIFGERRLLE
jgi:hypothetical protein